MLLVGNGTVITLGTDCRVMEGGAVLLKDGKIAAIGITADLQRQYPDAEYMDCRGKLIMPGFLNVHMHTYSTFARGIALKDEPPENFVQILERLWWRLDKTLALDDVYYSALIPFIESVKNGTTAILDHHASPFNIEGSLEQIARAAAEVGVRVNTCYEVSDRDGEERALAGIKENVDFIKKCQQENSQMLGATFGMHACFTIGEKTMEKCAQAAGELGVGVHIHAAESRADVEHNLKEYGLRVIERLNKHGLLGPKTMASHCVHINEREMELLAETKTNAAHNPQSNMNNAVGCADVIKMVEMGVMVGMGTDGMTSDMIEGMKAAHILHKFNKNDPRAGWIEVPTMQFINNPRIMANYFSLPMGELRKGNAADVIVIDYDPPTPLTEDNYYGHMVFGMTGRMVDTTIVAGKVLMRNKELLGIDEAEINAKSRELARKMWERF